LPGQNVEVVHTGVKPVKPSALENPKRELFGFADDAPVVSFVGLHSERKGVVDLADAAALVLDEYPRTKFVFAGRDGGKTREVTRRIGRYGIQEACRLLGPRDDIPDILAASDMIVLPALADPLPLAVLEAMSAGLPVVATDSGGCSEMVVDGKTGRIVPIRDPRRLAEAICELLRDSRKRKEMGCMGKARFDAHFSQQQYVHHFEAVLDAAIGASPNKGEDVAPLIGHLKQAAREKAKKHRLDAAAREKLKHHGMAMLRLFSILR
jgi:glycosyltransferase involved in cell wall biosynthesis